MDIQEEVQIERKPKKASKDLSQLNGPNASSQSLEDKSPSVKVSFEGEVARRILKFELELKDRLSKPDMGKVLGAEILSWSEKRWAELLEEHTDIEYFFSQIRKYPDKSKSIKLLKGVSEKLRTEMREPSQSEPQEEKIQFQGDEEGLVVS